MRLAGWVPQAHVGFLKRASPFPDVALRAGGYQVPPAIISPSMAWNDMIDGQLARGSAAVLALVVVPAEDFALAEPDTRPGALDHVSEPDDRRARDERPDCAHISTPIQDKLGLSREKEPQRAPGRADIERLVVCI